MKPQIAYKGFKQDLTCRDFQYEVGKTYKQDEKIVKCGESGFHSCLNPLDIFTYYDPASSVFHKVELGGEITTSLGKTVSSEITVKEELRMSDLIHISICWTMDEVSYVDSAHSVDDQSHATAMNMCTISSNTGYQSVASNKGGNSVASNTGCYSVALDMSSYSVASNTGYHSVASVTDEHAVASNTGKRSAASSNGNYSIASNTGWHSVSSSTGYRAVAVNVGSYSAAISTGVQSAAISVGTQSAASCTSKSSTAVSTGSLSAASVSGRNSIALACGYKAKAKASKGSAITVAHLSKAFKLIHIRSAIAGVEIEPDVYYMLDSDGEFVKAE